MTVILETPKSNSEKSQAELLKRVSNLSRAEFVGQFILPLLSRQESLGTSPDFTVSTIQNQDGTVTIRYQIAGAGRIVGKLFANGSGQEDYDFLTQLWNGGLDSKQAYRVPEPLGFLGEQSMLLYRIPDGTSLASLMAGEPEEALRAVKEAAQWLSRFHKSAATPGRKEGPLDLLVQITDQSSLATSKHPQEVKRLTNMLDAIERLGPSPNEPERRLVHGMFNPANILVENGAVTGVNLDNSMLSDPTRDLGDFTEALMQCLRGPGSAGQTSLLVQSFLDEYARSRGSQLDNTAFYLALRIFLSLCRDITTLETGSKEYNAAFDHYSAVFERTISGEYTGGGGTSEPATKDLRDWYLSRKETRNRQNTQVRQKAQEITKPEFIERAVYPTVFNKPFDDSRDLDCDASIVHVIGTGRATVSYLFGDKTMVYGKLYSDKLLAEQGFRIHKTLWDTGFNSKSPFQVVEPIAYLPENGLVLTRGAAGQQLAPLVEELDPNMPDYVRRTAQWLVKLHSSTLRIGRPESMWHSAKLLKLARRVAKAVARDPNSRGLLMEMMEDFCKYGPRLYHKIPRVQAHGRFHYDHIFVDHSTVSLIDVDNCAPADPSKDLAEFLRLLRKQTFKVTGSTAKADLPSRVFLKEYLSSLPDNAKNLGLHWGSFVLMGAIKTVKKHGKKGKLDDETFQRMMDFYRKELDDVLSGKFMEM